jgi:hypothetical protein
MKTLKVFLLLAVIALGVTGAAKGAQAACCSSADCCASVLWRLGWTYNLNMRELG